MNALQTTRTQETFQDKWNNANTIFLIKVLCIIISRTRRGGRWPRRGGRPPRRRRRRLRRGRWSWKRESEALTKSKSSCSWTQVVLMTRRKHTWSFVAIKCWR